MTQVVKVMLLPGPVLCTGYMPAFVPQSTREGGAEEEGKVVYLEYTRARTAAAAANCTRGRRRRRRRTPSQPDVGKAALAVRLDATQAQI